MWLFNHGGYFMSPRPTFLTLRADVEVLLTGLIGTYKIGTAPAVPALWVAPPQPPSNRVVTGLEVIIQKVPDVKTNWLLNSRTIIKEQWSVTLYQRDATKSTHDAVRILLQNYVGATVVTTPANDTFYEQSRVYIPSTHLIKVKP